MTNAGTHHGSAAEVALAALVALASGCADDAQHTSSRLYFGCGGYFEPVDSGWEPSEPVDRRFEVTPDEPQVSEDRDRTAIHEVLIDVVGPTVEVFRYGPATHEAMVMSTDTCPYWGQTVERWSAPAMMRLARGYVDGTVEVVRDPETGVELWGFDTFRNNGGHEHVVLLPDDLEALDSALEESGLTWDWSQREPGHARPLDAGIRGDPVDLVDQDTHPFELGFSGYFINEAGYPTAWVMERWETERVARTE